MDRVDVPVVEVVCKDCGATGIAYQEGAWNPLGTDKSDYLYWMERGMWGNAETEARQCEDHYPLSWKNLQERMSMPEMLMLMTVLKGAKDQVTDLHEMGLTPREGMDIVMHTMEAELLGKDEDNG